MEIKDNTNSVFQLAVDMVNDTAVPIFLTGKAGTGKTTFLKYIREHTPKNAVIVAPTGVAAINAGGVTMHSFFQLPRGMFLPSSFRREDMPNHIEINDRHSLFRNIRFSSEKRKLLQELELLIIDEISMVRCDMLDAVDLILRHFRRAQHLPFGGVQVVYIGDLYQLPPVASNEEWEILKAFYKSPFFFDSRVVMELPPVYLELKKIYRQSDQEFIDVLNRIRNNIPAPEDFKLFRDKYDPNFDPGDSDHYITITTHNYKADAINAAALNRLPGNVVPFKATISNDFSEKSYPTDPELKLKPGAQVMFIKNDTGTDRRFFNGKIAIVSSINGEQIKVRTDGDAQDLILEKETWKNIRYSYNETTDKIEEEELGSFSQFPVRLAWAITIHKSQGLTFEKAIIDAGSSFAPGQVYVALSRCTSLTGMVLKSFIPPSAISTDARIISFVEKEAREVPDLQSLLDRERYQFGAQRLIKLFDWSKLLIAIEDWVRSMPEKKIPDLPQILDIGNQVLSLAKSQSETARKFQHQLRSLIAETQINNDSSFLEERLIKAINYFGKELSEKILLPVRQHRQKMVFVSRTGKYRKELESLEKLTESYLKKFAEARWAGKVLAPHNFIPAGLPVGKNSKAVDMKVEKVSSPEITVQLFKEGKDISEIAQLRNLARSTIEGHLSKHVLLGNLKAEELISSEKLNTILDILKESEEGSVGQIKSRLGDEYSFYEIWVGLNHFRFLQNNEVKVDG